MVTQTCGCVRECARVCITLPPQTVLTGSAAASRHYRKSNGGGSINIPPPDRVPISCSTITQTNTTTVFSPPRRLRRLTHSFRRCTLLCSFHLVGFPVNTAMHQANKVLSRRGMTLDYVCVCVWVCARLFYDHHLLESLPARSDPTEPDHRPVTVAPAQRCPS